MKNTESLESGNQLKASTVHIFKSNFQCQLLLWHSWEPEMPSYSTLFMSQFRYYCYIDGLPLSTLAAWTIALFVQLQKEGIVTQDCSFGLSRYCSYLNKWQPVLSINFPICKIGVIRIILADDVWVANERNSKSMVLLVRSSDCNIPNEFLKHSLCQ